MLGGYKIRFHLDMRGLAQKVRIAYGVLVNPGDRFKIINTAVDPDGVHYWKFVNDGTGPKGVTEKPYLVFMVNDELMYATAVKGNPAVHMLERATPMVKEFFKEALREYAATGKNASRKDITFQWMDSVFERTAEKLKELLEELTPEIDDKYINPDPTYGTPEPGLLKNSYEVQRIDESDNE